MRWKVCDACQNARASVETESGFFLCKECETVVVVAFTEFELPAASPISDWKGLLATADANRLR
ncbi:MAG: hypothetical protein WCA28_09410 [Bradyrhizobium sp.]